MEKHDSVIEIRTATLFSFEISKNLPPSLYAAVETLHALGLMPTPVSPRKLSKKELNQIALKCIDEVNIDVSVIHEVLRTEILPRDNQKYKKFLACSYKKQGYLSPDGKEMIYSNLFKFLEEFYDISELEGLERCKLIKEEDPGELCFQNLDCILTGLHRIDAEREIGSNHI